MGRSIKQRTPSVPIGGLLPLAGASGPNPTIDGAEYLKTSVLKAIAGYEGLLTSAVELTVAVGTRVLSTVGLTNGILLNANGWLYGVGTDASTPYKTSDPVNVAWTSVGASATFTDGFVFGSRAVLIAGADGIVSLLDGARTDITTTQAQAIGVANNAGTLAVTSAGLLAGGAGAVTTSTNGTTWTDRTPTGGTGVAILCDWNQAGGVFFFIGSNGHAYSTTNGYTLTDRGAISGATSASPPVSAFKSRARSSTSNVMVLTLTIGGVSGAYIVRTTDGVTYTTTLVATALQLDGFQSSTSLQIAYVDSKYVIYNATAYSGLFASVFYTSSDDGLTWQRGSIPIVPASSSPGLPMLASGSVAGQFLAIDGSNTGAALFSGLSATHVGIAKALAMQSYNTSNTSKPIPLYVRIK